MTTGETAPTASQELQALVETHRQILRDLEARLAAVSGANTATQVSSPQDVRAARSEVRRAARTSLQEPDEIFVAERVPVSGVPEAREVALQQLAGARRSAWRRSGEALALIRAGDTGAAIDALEDIVTIELAIRTVTDNVPLPAVWRKLGEELGAASDTVIASARAQIAELRKGGSGTGALARMSGAQSAWLRAWRVFIQVAPERIA